MTRLLIGYDGSDFARAAITTAGALFGRAEAVVATVHPPPPSLESGALARIALPDAMIREGIQRMRDEAQQHASATAQEGAGVADAAGLRATASVLTGLSAWRALRAEAVEVGADAVVCGTQGQRAFERVVLGSTASSLLHHADLPLFVVPRSEAPLDGPWLAGYDDSDGAREALRFFAGHVRHRSLVVAHVWRSPVRHTRRGQALVHSGIDTFADHVETVDRICAEAAQETAEGGVAYARGIGLTAVAAAPESRDGAWRALLARAREAGAAAILVGSRGRGAVTSTVLGSVASGLVHAAALPVLVVPER